MPLTSLGFFFFLLLTTIIFWLSPTKYRVWILLFASYVWYSVADLFFLPLLLGTTLIDYYLAHRIFRSENRNQRLAMLTASICLNLGILIFFKVSTQVIPLGVSFYTFHSISYMVDVFRKKHSPSRSLSQYALYVAFFPKIVAGPIERFSDFSEQLASKRTIQLEFFTRGLLFILFGVYLKSVVGDSLALLVAETFDKSSTSSPLLGIYAYSAQIYADFLGYTLIARGAALFFGLELSRNFLHPYLSLSPQDFWRRWHTSLSFWFRDYVYIPLGGSRHSWVRNILITMGLAGVWHGASLQFFLWGIYHGFFLLLGFAVQQIFSPIFSNSGNGLKKAGLFLSWFLTLQMACLGWVFFRAANAQEAGKIFARLAQNPELGGSSGSLAFFLTFALPWMIYGLMAKAGFFNTELVAPDSVRRRYAFLAGLCFVAILLFGDSSGAPFIYFKF